MIRPAERLQRVPPYPFAELERKVAAARARGVDLIDLGIGDPDLPTPSHVVEAARSAVGNSAYHRYPPNWGLEVFRREAAAYYQRRFGVELDWRSELLALIGSKEGLAHVVWAFVDPGDVALVPDPAYPVYRSQVLLAGGEPFALPLIEQRDFLPDLQAVPPDVARRAKLLFLNYPNNPTAGVTSLDFLAQAVAFCREYNILLVHDLAYAEMTYDGYVAPSALQIQGARKCCLEFYSLSKPFNMTGWRLAFCAGAEKAVAALAKVKSGLDSSQFSALQEAGAKALSDTPPEFLSGMNRMYTRRRDLLCDGLNRIGLDCRRPKGTFYLWPRIPAGWDSSRFTEHLLSKAGVVVTPGSAFGACGEGFVRMALTVPEERIVVALERISSIT
ncbi:MAG: LL-diaminopimelate aminotransferase [Bacillota bacterium]|nr:LL-diaminopimelate aminotransferase [Bacillota bacterium]